MKISNNFKCINGISAFTKITMAVIALSAFFMTAAAQTVTAEEEFYEAVAAYETAAEDVIIEVGESFTITSIVTIPAPAKEGITLTIRSADAASPAVLKRGVKGTSLFAPGLLTIDSGAALILEDIIIDGGNQDDFARVIGVLIRGNGDNTFVMNDGAVLRNNTNSYMGGSAVCLSGGSTFIMNGGEISGNDADGAGGGGSGAYLSNSAFIMNGGEISGNISGAVDLRNSSTFTMNGGKITGNTGYGVYMAEGTFDMVGGEISGNNGRGVHIGGSNTLFTMNGGKITDNTAVNCGGVYLVSGGTFILNDGEISGNTAEFPSSGIVLGGGGVYVSGNETVFTMTGGKIRNNKASYGSGVHLSGGTFTMTGGEISENQDGTDGGGVYVNGGTFTMNNGKITGNQKGGGVYVNSGTFTLNDGEISENQRTFDGGGVSVGGTFTMNGGKICDNISGDGGGVSVGKGTFTMTGGQISKNTANSGDGGGVRLGGGKFIMTGGEISNNKSVFDGRTVSGSAVGGGGVYVGGGTFTMTGGKIKDNSASGTGSTGVYGRGGGVHVSRGIFIINGGEVSGNTSRNPSSNIDIWNGVFLIVKTAGTIAEDFNVIEGVRDYQSNIVPAYPVIITWDKPIDDGPFLYGEGTSHDLTVLPAGTAAAVWAVNKDKFGISYENGTKNGFIEIDAMTHVSVLPPNKYHLQSKPVPAQSLRAFGSTLHLQLADRGNVAVYALDGKRVRAFEVGLGVHRLRLNDLPRGMYVVRVNSRAWKQSAKIIVK